MAEDGRYDSIPVKECTNSQGYVKEYVPSKYEKVRAFLEKEFDPVKRMCCGVLIDPENYCAVKGFDNSMHKCDDSEDFWSCAEEALEKKCIQMKHEFEIMEVLNYVLKNIELRLNDHLNYIKELENKIRRIEAKFEDDRFCKKINEQPTR